MQSVQLFEHYEFAKGIVLRNRFVMAPMTTWAANQDGTVSDEEIAYFRRRSNDVGLVITGCSHVSANGIGFVDEFAAFDDRYISGLSQQAAAAKSGGAPAILQLFHAGNQAVADLLDEDEIVSAGDVASSGSIFHRVSTPRPLTEDEIQTIIKDFGQATRRAIEAGFDGVELHGAHGFLLQNFMSPYYNNRTDQWGGTLENRLRFPLAVIREVLDVINTYAKGPFLLGYRISPEESQENGLRLEEFYPLIDEMIGLGIDYLHLSQPKGLLTTKPIDDPEGELIAEHIVRYVSDRVPLIAAGGIRSSESAQAAIALGLSSVAIGQSLVTDPDWVKHVKLDQTEQILNTLSESTFESRVIPKKMWSLIKNTPGWFPVVSDE